MMHTRFFAVMKMFQSNCFGSVKLIFLVTLPCSAKALTAANDFKWMVLWVKTSLECNRSYSCRLDLIQI